MPLPLLAVGALAIAGYGIKKGVDAKDDFDSAQRLNRQASDIYEYAKEQLDNQRLTAQKSMEQLGKTKINIYKNSVLPFVKLFQEIKNIEFKELNLKDETMSPPEMDELKKICDTSLHLEEYISGGITALGAGGIAGLATYGSVGTLAAASTGTAISSLSGAAATNATLAWLGGGSLASGGLGIAGGTAVLGGIVAAPVLAVGGMVMASKAEAAKEDAYSNRLKAELAEEQMKTAQSITSAIEKQFKDMNTFLNKLDDLFVPLFNIFAKLVENNKNYQQYSDMDKKGVFITVGTIQLLKMLLDAPILNDEGLPTQYSKNIIQNMPELCNEVQVAIHTITNQ